VTILVTGGAGFIGSHMADHLLARGHRVVILDNLCTGFEENVPAAAEFVKGDVRDPGAVAAAFDKGVEAVFHIAGQASTIVSFDDPAEDLSVNVTGTLNVMNECIRRRVTRVLYASSMTAYGVPAKLPVTEDEPVRPISYYGITKEAAERYLFATAGRVDLDFDFHVTAFRMFNVYGERQSLDNPYQGVVTIFMANILKGEPITIFSDGEQTRDFVYIGDVADAWLRALDNPASYGTVYNVGAGGSISINRLVDVTLDCFGKSRETYEVRYLPERPGDQRHMTADISRLRTDLGWEPRVPFDDGMQRTLRWAVNKSAPGA
jgi:UDP-glucose 4-epimerase